MWEIRYKSCNYLVRCYINGTRIDARHRKVLLDKKLIFGENVHSAKFVRFPSGSLWWSFQSVLHARFKHVQINDLSRQTFDPILWKCDISNGTPLLITPNPVTCWSIETKHKVCLTKRIKDPNPIRGGTKSIKKHVRLFEKKSGAKFETPPITTMCEPSASA